MEQYALFHLEGGLGKHVAATAVARCIKNNHPDRKLIVVCAYPEVYLNLKFVDRVYRIGNTPYFYDDYIKDKDMLIFKHEPYFTTDHIVKRKPLIPNWCNLYNLEYKFFNLLLLTKWFFILEYPPSSSSPPSPEIATLKF